MDAFILSAVRTPIGKFLGGLSEFPAPKLGAVAIAEALKRASVKPDAVEDVIMGNVVQAGVGQAPARQAAIFAGLPDTIPAHTTNMVCGSGLKAVMLATQSIRAGDANIIVAGGMESMSRAPFLLQGVRQGYKYGNQTTTDALVNDGLWCAFENWPMGDAAEHIATKCDVSRADQDRFAAQSHQRAAAAWGSGAFAEEIVPVQFQSANPKKPVPPVEKDEGIRPDTTAEGLAKLKPAFRPDGTVTAGNSSQLSDGAAAVVVASSRFVETSGTKPLARIVSYTMSGVAPKDIFIAPVTAVQAACTKAKLAVSDIDLWELNEAFASQMLACGKGLNLDESKVNVHGGAVALGHPIGASGARVLVTLVHALKRHNKRYGCASLCLGGGNAVAVIVERV
ncbi:acetyl- acetyltransferase : Acetyl-CoA acetyltransferase OS=Singulisphaera acidiphila (strain ATCC BAA-1392 / DSM 18658 / VKM B-2454 / MOB10) GN=Sinac_6120 PE=3 SV=1: Thiolase_N: Thiolase_C [Gemmata massiliana]|uniref:Thiolase N-terminal domain-containing protein n=1 Tax=Gemmata massiliana TaxID=1210884 RepID=A0A6P2CU20_9BACT|nr:acetyl-CoA C-acetyltransferase [Gemmata massiliana]VTR92648.1 acetyl- acetyltransferase : Acetyl-CoA acetyltransferase OS=Singulisphaera acidiphila (strain ATCC BAA-1392 / DSM 18658 / VKM B-2454 / MOB10) GN=Sinac_6120 PE=3 SV=1: Thiolase_N: Thiolase_C [Gemmata massiliana]